jgi:hypothetical protein
MTQSVKNAGAWCNGEIAYLAWSVGKAKLPEDCVGFMITRIHENQDRPSLCEWSTAATETRRIVTGRGTSISFHACADADHV